ncbi:MAG: ribonuclease III [Ignavibacteriaceae bacterium]|nr:ribonuclease III [Ignavibacteriaceae bacterium]
MLGLFKNFLRRSKNRKILSKDRIRKIESLTGREIVQPEIFMEALTHRSHLDNKKFLVSNERLEFLGDALLGFVVAEVLSSHFSDKDEGFLTRVRANFVNRMTLFSVAYKIGIHDLLFMSDEIKLSEGSPGFQTILADAFEAFIGAIYINHGLPTAKDFITQKLVNPNLESGLHLVDNNYKSRLLELIQSLKLEIPRYKVIKEDGPEHDRVFTVQALVGERVLGLGVGKNKKAAEQEAAKVAYLNLTTATTDFTEN